MRGSDSTVKQMTICDNATAGSAGDWPAGGLQSLGACPVCGGSDRALLHERLTDRIYRAAPGEWKLYRCGSCGVAYLDPRPNLATIHLAYRRYCTHDEEGAPDMTELRRGRWARFRHALRNDYLNATHGFRLTPSLFPGRHLLRLVPFMKERADRFVRHFPPVRPGSRLLELGCGNGEFLETMRSLGWLVHGIEPDPKAVAAAVKRGVEVQANRLDEAGFEDASFDAISMNHVVEHLHDPVNTLSQCLRLLKPGGTISIATPNLESRGHRIFGRDWHFLHAPNHLVLFSTQSLCSLLSRLGYRDIVAHASFYGADSVFRDSWKLSGESNGTGVDGATYPSSLLRKIDHLYCALTPDLSEEAIVTARRPSIAS